MKEITNGPVYISPSEAKVLKKVLVKVIGAEEVHLSELEWQSIYDILDHMKVSGV